jgi:uncharacterized integral membrane protein
MNNTNITETLIALGSQTMQQAIQQYTYWHFIDAIVYFCLGLVFIIGSIILYKKYSKNEVWQNEAWPLIVIILLAIVGLFMCADNIVNIFEAKAYAIHQLISDIRG